MQANLGEIRAVKFLANKYAKTEAQKIYLLSRLVGHKIAKLADLEKKDWKFIKRSAYPNAGFPCAERWNLSKDFDNKCKLIMKGWAEYNSGQLTLDL